MKITAVKGIALRCTCQPISDALSTSRARQAMLVKIETDTELSGIGEAFTYGAPLAVMRYLVEETLAPCLIGKDPEHIGELWNTMYWRTIASGRRSMIMGAISGIDIALWDLMGKMRHQSIASMLGQKRDRIPSYASGGFYAAGKDVDGLRREVEGYRKQGYTDAKIKIGRNLDRPDSPLRYMADPCDAVPIETDWARIRAAKEIIGDGRLAVDTNASWDREHALKKIPVLEELGVSWLEEPIPFENLAGFAQLKQKAQTLSIIGCETQQVGANFAQMVNAGALDIVQPDVGWAGGISECRKIEEFAYATGLPMSLHCFGSAVLFAASLHVSAAARKLESLESEENPNPLKTDLMDVPFEHDDQMSWLVPEGDGLGIKLNEEKLEKYSVRL